MVADGVCWWRPPTPKLHGTERVADRRRAIFYRPLFRNVPDSMCSQSARSLAMRSAMQLCSIGERERGGCRKSIIRAIEESLKDTRFKGQRNRDLVGFGAL